MSEYDDLKCNYASAMAQDLRPLIPKVADALGIDDTERLELLSRFLADGWMDGAHAAQAELVAQAIEQGLDPDVLQLEPPDSTSA